MTVEKLKSYPGYEELTNEEAREILFSLEKLGGILFNSHRKAQMRWRSEEYKDRDKQLFIEWFMEDD